MQNNDLRITPPSSQMLPKQAAIYARVSTADGRQDTENQLVELRRFAATQGWEIVAEYIDHESGGKADRAQFRRMFSDAAQRRFDLVLVWALDRLTREGVAETFEYIKRLTSYGVQFVSFKEEHFRTTGPAGELMIAVAAWIAKQERVRISERVRAGMHRARVLGTKSGRAIGRPRVVFRRDEALELRTSGLSWRQIARKVGAGMTTVWRACNKNEAPYSMKEAAPQNGAPAETNDPAVQPIRADATEEKEQ